MLLFLSDATPNMVKIGEAFEIFYLKIYVSCIAFFYIYKLAIH